MPYGCLEELLAELPEDLALMALAAIPEEANAKELKIERRPELLLTLQSKAPEVLRHLCATGERTQELHISIYIHVTIIGIYESILCIFYMYM